MDSPWKSVSAAFALLLLALVVHEGAGGMQSDGRRSAILEDIAITRVTAALNNTAVPVLGAVSVVVPHHLTADSLIGRVAKTVSDARPKAIVLIGPDHRGKSSTAVALSASSWNFHDRMLPVDVDMVRVLAENDEFRVQEALVADEHSVLVPLPYFAAVFPDTKFVLLVVRNHLDVERVRAISETINSALGPNDLVVASADFSHYQNVAEADAEDERSLALLSAGDPTRFQELFTDSPEAVAIAQRIAMQRGLGAPTILDHANSARLLNDLSLTQTTSYITAVWARGTMGR